MKTLIIFMGPAGVGKSEIIEYVKKRHPQALVVSKKEIEMNFLNETHFQQNQRYYNTINEMLNLGDYIILDSHHVFKQDRIELFNSLNIIKDETNIIGIWIDNSWENILKNNASKPKNEQLDIRTLKYLFDYRSSPEADEPFNDLMYLILPANIGMSKTHPYLTTVYQALDKL